MLSKMGKACHDFRIYFTKIYGYRHKKKYIKNQYIPCFAQNLKGKTVIFMKYKNWKNNITLKSESKKKINIFEDKNHEPNNSQILKNMLKKNLKNENI